MEPGSVIDGKYRIEAKLGEGGMGRVLAATHVTLGSSVAIKILKSEALRYPEVPRRFLREARSASRLRGEHVARVQDIGQLPTGEPYMVMELLQGHDLSSLLEQQGPLPPGAAVEYIAQACQGLAEAHAIGMVHRDVKPANLFVTTRPNGTHLVKVLDFGIATAAIGDVDHNLTTTLTVIGSPSYMSPEQLRAAKDVDPRSDIWSLGVTLYEILSGQQPFVGPTLTALTLKIVGEPHTPLQNVPPHLASIVERCLAKERADRFANVAELAAALAPFSPNGRSHAEHVAGALSGSQSGPINLGSSTGIPHVAGTVYSVGSGPQHRAPSAPWQPPTSTTDLTAGESAPMPRRSRPRRAFWIGFGTAMAGAIVSAGIVLSQRNSSSAAPLPAAAPPSASAPIVTPIPEPVTPPPAPPEAPPPAPPAPDKLAAPPPPEEKPVAPPPAPPPPEEKPVALPPPEEKPVKQPAKQPVKRPPVKRPPPRDPSDHTKLPKDPVKAPPKDSPKDPPKDPVKKPCAPNDPTCGL